MELDGYGSPSALAARIHELDPNLALDFSIEDLARRLDIADIQVTHTTAYEAAIVMDKLKASGAILLARSSGHRRRRFSIGHELGHFLIPSHVPHSGHGFSCSHADLLSADTAAKDRQRRIEAEANRFASLLLMPPDRIRKSMTMRQPDLAEILRLADTFDVSKAAMARSYVDAHRATLALVVLRNGRLEQVYRPADFPWIAPSIGMPVPEDSIAYDHRLMPGQLSELEDCEPDTWVGEYAARKVEVLSEQVLAQRDGYATILLHAELDE